MLALILIFYIGRAFYRLAKQHDRSKWLFAILGVVMYYVAQLVFAAILLVIIYANDSYVTTQIELIATLGGIGIGALSVWLFYYLLKKAWEKNPKSNDNELLDQL
jgi:hypothetical protein